MEVLKTARFDLIKHKFLILEDKICNTTIVVNVVN